MLIDFWYVVANSFSVGSQDNWPLCNRLAQVLIIFAVLKVEMIIQGF